MATNTDNLIHSIALDVGAKDEQVVREVALTVTEYFMPSNYSQEQLLEMLHLYLADGQETRSIVHEFRSKLYDLGVKTKNPLQQADEEYEHSLDIPPSPFH